VQYWKQGILNTKATRLVLQWSICMLMYRSAQGSGGHASVHSGVLVALESKSHANIHIGILFALESKSHANVHIGTLFALESQSHAKVHSGNLSC